MRIFKKELPRFILLSDVAIDSRLIDAIKTMREESSTETILFLQIPRLMGYDNHQIKVGLPLWKVVEILNQYKKEYKND